MLNRHPSWVALLDPTAGTHWLRSMAHSAGVMKGNIMALCVAIMCCFLKRNSNFFFKAWCPEQQKTLGTGKPH